MKIIKYTLIALSLLFVGTIKLVASGSTQLDLGNIVGKAGQALGNLTATDNFEPTALIGSWKYDSPSVQFQSDNALSKVGGAAAGTAVESKLSPYYKTLGLNKMTLTVDDNLNFVISLDKVKLTGKITKDNKKLYFNFNAFDKINIGKVGVLATKSATGLNLAFDAKKLVSIAKTLGKISGQSSINSIISILEKYDGIYVGARLKK